MQHFPWRTLCLGSALALASSCNNGSSGGAATASPIVIDEVEPNDDSTTATALLVGEAGGGTVADNTDSDFWSVTLAEGELITIESFAVRLDQATWIPSDNSTRITIYDTDGTTALLSQSWLLFSFIDDQDTDIDIFRAPAAGTYFVGIDVSTAAAGGDYVVKVSTATVPTPLQFEAELAGVSGTNDTDVTAEAIVPGTVHGFHVDNESDFFSFDVGGPSKITFRIRTHRNGVWQSDSYYDPEINLYDPSVTVIDNDDDTYYFDSSIEYIVTSPGTYFLEVLECCEDGDAPYFLEFELVALADMNPIAEVEPNDTLGTAQAIQFDSIVQGTATGADDDLYSIACNGGDRILVQVFDDSKMEGAASQAFIDILDPLSDSVPTDGDGGLQVTRTILTATGTYSFKVTSAFATDYAFVVTQIPGLYEVEPNSTLAEASAFDVNGRAAGTMDVSNDEDYFSFSGTAGVPVLFHCLAAETNVGFSELNAFGSSMLPRLAVLDATSVLVGSSEPFAESVGTFRGLSSTSLAFVPPVDGIYYLRVTEFFSAFGPAHFYALTME